MIYATDSPLVFTYFFGLIQAYIHKTIKLLLHLLQSHAHKLRRVK